MTSWTTEIGRLEPYSRAFTEERFRAVFQYEKREKPSFLKTVRGKLKCSKHFLFTLIPVLEWLPKYDFKNDILNDVLIAAIITPMLLQIELSTADIAKIPLVVGLYASVFPPMIYFFMGTSKHTAIGMSPTISMMIGMAVTKYANNRQLFDQEYSPLQIATALTLLSGFWLLFIGIFRLGSLSRFLSDSFTSALYIAGAIHIILGRLKTMFGINYPDPPDLYIIFFHCYELLNRIADTNLVTFGLSSSVVIGLMIFNLYAKRILDLKFPKSKAPLVFQLCLIVISGLSSYFLDLNNNYNVGIVGQFPTGVPNIEIPPFEIFPTLILDSLILSIVAIPVYLPITKMLAEKYNYKIDYKQEMIAYGVSNILSSFLSCPLTGNSVSRTLIQDTMGGGSQFSNLFTAIFVIFVLLFVGPIVKYLPISVLSSIIVVHLIKQIIENEKFPEIYRKSKLDGAMWLITFCTSILFNINYGIIAGIAACVIATLIPSQKAKVIVLGRVPGTEMFLAKNYFKSAITTDTTLILKIIGNIQFANSENIHDKILQLVQTYQKHSIRFIVLNLDCVGYIDPSGVKSLLSVAEALKKMELTPSLFITDCLPDVYEKLIDCEFFKMFPKNQVFASVKDAIEFSVKYQEDNDVYETRL